MRVVLLAEPSGAAQQASESAGQTAPGVGKELHREVPDKCAPENICIKTEAGKSLVVRTRNMTVIIHVEAPADPLRAMCG